jgi:hypothetical protein
MITKRSIFQRVLRVLLWTFSILLVLILLAIGLLISPPGKRIVRDQLLSFLRNKLHTEVQLEAVQYALPKMVGLKGFLLKDRANDTLLYAGSLKVDIDLLQLLDKQVSVNDLLLEDVLARAYRHAPDTSFNFTYIIEAFAAPVDTPAAKKKDASPFVFDVGRVHLDRIRIDFTDETGGIAVKAAWDKLHIRMQELVPDKMLFRLKSLDLAGFKAYIRRDSSLLQPTPDTDTQQMPILGLKKLNLTDVDFLFEDRTSDMRFTALLPSLSVESDTLDIIRQRLVVKDLNLAGLQSSFSYHSRAAIDSDSVVAAPWYVRLGKVKIVDAAWRMDDRSQRPLTKGIDYAHLDVRQLAFESEQLLYAPGMISGNIQRAGFKERSGLSLQQLQTQFYYADTGLGLKHLVLRTDRSRINGDVQSSYTSPTDFQHRLADLPIFLSLEDCSVDFKDAALFAPSLDTMRNLSALKAAPILLDAQITGLVKDLDINRLKILAAGNTMLSLQGRLSGLPDAEKLRYALKIDPFRSTRQVLLSFIPPASRDRFRLPDRFALSGALSGTTKDYHTNLLLQSSDGSAQISGDLLLSGGQDKEQYDLLVRTQSLNLGRILKKDTLMGPITATVAVKGSSFDPHKMNTRINTAVHEALIKGYAYRDIDLKGRIESQQGDFRLTSADPNARFSIDASADLRREFIALYAKVLIDSFDAQATGWSNEPLKIKTQADINASSLNPDYPDATIYLMGTSVATANSVYVGDSLSIISKPTADSGQQIDAHLEFLQARLVGKTPLRAIAPAVAEHINRHYHLSDTANIRASSDSAIPPMYNLQLQASLYPSPLLRSFLPQLTRLDTIGIHASLNRQAMHLDAHAAEIVYQGQQLSGLNARIDERDSAFTYSVQFDRYTNGSIRLLQTNLQGAVDSNRIVARLDTKDSTQKDRFRIGLNLKTGTQTEITLQPDLLLDYRNWTVAQPNRFVIQKEGVYAENILLRGDGAELSVNSTEAAASAPMNIRIRQFEIADLTRLLSGDTAIASGLLEGTATLHTLKPSPLFDADLSIGNLSFKGDTLGNLSVKGANDRQQTVNTQVRLSGNGNELELKGDYYASPRDGNDMDMNLKVSSLNLKSLEGLAAGQIKESSGGLKSDLHLHGTFKAPLLDGTLQTTNLQTTVSALNARFSMPSETMRFQGQQLQFDQFRILDSSGNPATLNGTVQFKDLRNPLANLSLDARNWKALSAAKGANDYAYGSLVLSTRLSVNGPLRQPSVNGSLTIEKGTNLSILLPDRGTSFEDYSGIIVFEDSRHPNELKPIVVNDSMKAPLMAGSDLNVNLLTDENAEFNVIIDQATGDFLNVRGKAQINTSMDRGGSLTMNGIYEISGGAYQLNYNLIKRKFDISKGSTITFAGDPLAAEMNITAVYKANVPPYDLVERQVPDQSQLVYYRQSLPFQVQLMMNGPVMTPLLHFDIVLPENQTYRLSSDAIQLVQAKLSQLRIDTSELNKQVFALLILKRFITDDPFSSGTGTTAEFAAKQSVSRFIGEQLNQLAGQLINGFDLSVDLASTEDYTSGTRRERTDLSVAASKRLLNDRLKVTIGNNFELEGPQTKSNNANSSLIPGNLAVDYSLTSDNRYTIRAYRQSLDQGVIQGFVTETGLNFIVNYDYNRFRNLFLSRRKMLQRRQQRKQAPIPFIQKK